MRIRYLRQTYVIVIRDVRTHDGMPRRNTAGHTTTSLFSGDTRTTRICRKQIFRSSLPSFYIESANISCDEVVKLLGIDIDYQLNFDKHIKNICRKASQQLSVLKRIGCFFYLSLIS